MIDNKGLDELIKNARKELDTLEKCVKLSKERIDALDGNTPSETNLLAINTLLAQTRIEAARLAETETKLTTATIENS